jgi:DNA-binding response OmpR family regulator
MRILIVEDDKTFCEFLAEVLRGKGHDVDWTTHSLQGYKMSLRKHYELFVFDVRMSPLLGTELAEVKTTVSWNKDYSDLRFCRRAATEHGAKPRGSSSL